MEIARTIVPTREGYERWAEVYDSSGNPMIALEDRYFPPMLPEVQGLLIADVGCGTGRQTRRLASRGARVVALDFSDAMLNRARQTADPRQVSFVLADVVASIPVKSGAFDGAVCSLVLEHVEDLAAMLRELRRVCKAGGFVLFGYPSSAGRQRHGGQFSGSKDRAEDFSAGLSA